MENEDVEDNELSIGSNVDEDEKCDEDLVLKSKGIQIEKEKMINDQKVNGRVPEKEEEEEEDEEEEEEEEEGEENKSYGRKLSLSENSSVSSSISSSSSDEEPNSPNENVWSSSVTFKGIKLSAKAMNNFKQEDDASSDSGSNSDVDLDKEPASPTRNEGVKLSRLSDDSSSSDSMNENSVTNKNYHKPLNSNYVNSNSVENSFLNVTQTLNCNSVNSINCENSKLNLKPISLSGNSNFESSSSSTNNDKKNVESSSMFMSQIEDKDVFKRKLSLSSDSSDSDSSDEHEESKSVESNGDFRCGNNVCNENASSQFTNNFKDFDENSSFSCEKSNVSFSETHASFNNVDVLKSPQNVLTNSNSNSETIANSSSIKTQEISSFKLSLAPKKLEIQNDRALNEINDELMSSSNKILSDKLSADKDLIESNSMSKFLNNIPSDQKIIAVNQNIDRPQISSMKHVADDNESQAVPFIDKTGADNILRDEKSNSNEMMEEDRINDNKTLESCNILCPSESNSVDSEKKECESMEVDGVKSSSTILESSNSCKLRIRLSLSNRKNEEGASVLSNSSLSNEDSNDGFSETHFDEGENSNSCEKEETMIDVLQVIGGSAMNDEISPKFQNTLKENKLQVVSETSELTTNKMDVESEKNSLNTGAHITTGVNKKECFEIKHEENSLLLDRLTEKSAELEDISQNDSECEVTNRNNEILKSNLADSASIENSSKFTDENQLLSKGTLKDKQLLLKCKKGSIKFKKKIVAIKNGCCEENVMGSCPDNDVRKGEKVVEPQLTEYAQYLGLQPTLKFKCCICAQIGFQSYTELREHQKNCQYAEAGKSFTMNKSREAEAAANTDKLISTPNAEDINQTNFRITRKVYLCSACGTYYENWNLFLHMREVHKRYICLLCLSMFTMSNKLADHLITTHDVKVKSFENVSDFKEAFNCSFYVSCADCGKLFSETDDWSAHQCQFTCSVCNIRNGHLPRCARNHCLKPSKPLPLMNALQTTKTTLKVFRPALTTTIVNSNEKNYDFASSFCCVDMNETEQNPSTSQPEPELEPKSSNKCEEKSNPALPSTLKTEEKDKLEEKSFNLKNDNMMDIDNPNSPVVLSESKESNSTEITAMEKKLSSPNSCSVNVNGDMDLDVNTKLDDLASDNDVGRSSGDLECMKNKNKEISLCKETVNTESCDITTVNKSDIENEELLAKDKSKKPENLTEHTGMKLMNSSLIKELNKPILEFNDNTNIKEETNGDLNKTKDKEKELDNNIQTSMFDPKETVEEKEDEEMSTNHSVGLSSVKGERLNEPEPKVKSELETESNETMECESVNNEKINNNRNEEEEEATNYCSDSDSNRLSMIVDNDNDNCDNGTRDNEMENIGGDMNSLSAEEKSKKDEKMMIDYDGDNAVDNDENELSNKEKSLCKTNMNSESDDVVVANEDIAGLTLTLNGTLDSINLNTIVKECVRTSCTSCAYCNHALKIAVNGKELILHLLAEHRFTPIRSEDSFEKLVAILKNGLDSLENVYFNTDSYDSSDKSSNLSYDGTFSCFQCPFWTLQHKELYTHKRKMHQKTILLCVMCKSNFYSYSELLCHMCPGTYQPNDILFRCCFCHIDKIPSAFRLMVHIRKMHHTCEICLDVSTDQQKLATHMWKHKLHHLCYRCGIAYRNKPDITRHLFWKHGTESIVCKKCLQKKWPHVYHFCIPPSVFVCEECNASFSRNVALRVHKRLHSNEKPYACTQCEERFISKKILAKHEISHSTAEEKVSATNVEKKENCDTLNSNRLLNAIDIPVQIQKTDEKQNIDIVDEGVSLPSNKKSKTKKTKPVLDLTDLPPLNLSSESDSEEEVIKSESKKSEASETSSVALVEEATKIEDKLSPKALEIKEESEKISDEKNNIIEYSEAQRLEMVLADHDYCLQQTDEKESSSENKTNSNCLENSDSLINNSSLVDTKETSISDSSPSKRKLKSPKKKLNKSSMSSSSSSSSDTDSSSCSCGPNCSCSSSSSDSSSSSSSDSDSSNPENRRKQEERRQKRRERVKVKSPKVEAEGSKSEGMVTVTVESEEPIILESDLETDVTLTDEDFYDEYPQQHANKMLAEKRDQLMLLASVAPTHTAPSSPVASAEETPVSQQTPASSPKLKKKLKMKRKRHENSVTPPCSQNTLSTPPLITKLPNPNSKNFQSSLSSISTPVTPSVEHFSDRTQSTGGSGSESESKRLSKRRRVKNKFYGYSSGEENDGEENSFKPRFKLKKVQKQMSRPKLEVTLPQPVSTSPVVRAHIQPSIIIRPPVPSAPSTPSTPFVPSISESRKTMPTLYQRPPSPSSSSDSDDDKLNIDEKFSESSQPLPTMVPQQSSEKNSSLYCYCQCPYDEVSEMIACDGDNCRIEWFHFECVGIMVPPKGQWFCPDCRKKKDFS